jgi:hypothetical protein
MRKSLERHRVSNTLVELRDKDMKGELEAILKSSFRQVFWVDPKHVYGSMKNERRGNLPSSRLLTPQGSSRRNAKATTTNPNQTMR